MRYVHRVLFKLLIAFCLVIFACSQEEDGTDIGDARAQPTSGSGISVSDGSNSISEVESGSIAPVPAGSSAGTDGTNSGTSGTIPISGTEGGGISGSGDVVAGTSGAAAGTSGAVAGMGGTDAGEGGAGADAGGNTTGLPPTIRNPDYPSVAPPVGEALPQIAANTWDYVEFADTQARDGSPAGFYYKLSDTSSNLMIYLVGGGACQDAFFCNNNPPNKTVSLFAESVLNGAVNLLGPTAVPQDPTIPMWQTGIFKNDPRNPVADWNMVFIPYVTGDVYAGNRANGTVPGYTSPTPLQFFGYSNMTKFLSRIIPTFLDAETVLLTGSSAGGIGALLNINQVADGFIDNSNVGVSIVVVDDAGAVFDDQFLEPCLQKRWREIWNLNDTLPQDCDECFNADGGGIAAGYLKYIQDKYPNAYGGIVDSTEDEIMKLFFSDGINNCDPANYPPITFLAYPAGQYTQGLIDLRDNHLDNSRMSTYYWTGALHQNFFNPVAVDRFYETNGLEMTVVDWLTKVLNGESLHLGN